MVDYDFDVLCFDNELNSQNKSDDKQDEEKQEYKSGEITKTKQTF